MGYSTIANPDPELNRGSFDVGGGSRWARWRRQMWTLPYGLELKPGATAELKPGETVKGPYAQDERGGPD